MLIVLCQKCRGFVKDETELFEVRIQTGVFTETLQVCQKCYNEVTVETYESKLLLES